MKETSDFENARRRDRECIFRLILVLTCLIGICTTLPRRGNLEASANVVQRDNSSEDGAWQYLEENSITAPGRRNIVPQAYRTVRLNHEELNRLLARAPMEFTDQANQNPQVMSLPMPDWSFARFRVEESPMMEPTLAARFPEIRTYRGQGIDDPTATTRFDWTPAGFHAIVLSSSGTVYIDPYSDGDTVNYITYAKRDYSRFDREFVCSFDQEISLPPESNHAPTPTFVSGSTLRTYRLALAATGEYTQAAGGTVPLALARMTTSMNRVNGIYEREVSVRMTLVANETLIIYTNGATDPYTNNNGSTMLGQNQTNLDAVIGSANYDIGHVFSTGGGGVASLGVPCRVGLKGRGVTGLPNPVGDGFDVDFVAHEMGHQYGALHTFNGATSNCAGNRSAAAAFEPGSGSTIMAYAGICGAQNLQPHSDDYFHSRSLSEIISYVTGANGNSCPVQTATGNTAPTVDPGASFTIPKGTPFALTAMASDSENPTLTYCWEELDLGPASPPDTDADGQSRPILRSYLPTSNPSRNFPSLQYILNNGNQPPTSYSCSTGNCLTGEILPAINRVMNFQVTARDNNAGGGGVSSGIVQVTVNASSGPFGVTNPNTSVSWAGDSTQTVTWDVAGTSGAPINAANVKISLSTNGGNTFPTVLAASTPNDGSESVTVPGAATTQARIKVEAVGNIFFDISNLNFTITASSGGADTIGLFRPTGNLFFLRNSNTPGFPDITVAFGAPGDLPVVGDWDGNGTMTIGLYRESSSTFFLRNSNTAGFPDITVSFGDGPGSLDVPIVGDWNGDGVWTIGVYRRSTSTFYLRNTNTPGFPDLSIPYGAALDLPVVGDWDGNGTTTIGIYRPTDSIFYLRNSNTTGFPDLSVLYGAFGDQPIVGDWDGNGTVTIGLYRPSESIFFLRNSNTTGFPDLSVPYGATLDKPLAGNWDGM